MNSIETFSSQSTTFTYFQELGDRIENDIDRKTQKNFAYFLEPLIDFLRTGKIHQENSFQLYKSNSSLNCPVCHIEIPNDQTIYCLNFIIRAIAVSLLQIPCCNESHCKKAIQSYIHTIKEEIGPYTLPALGCREIPEESLQTHEGYKYILKPCLKLDSEEKIWSCYQLYIDYRKKKQILDVRAIISQSPLNKKEVSFKQLLFANPDLDLEQIKSQLPVNTLGGNFIRDYIDYYTF